MAERKAELDAALERATSFHEKWKRQTDFLGEVEKGIEADWKPRGLPEPCVEELTSHQVRMYIHVQ